MKVNGSVAPSASFTVRKEGDKAIITFYENVKTYTVTDNNTDETRTECLWNE